jgi:hypothetical protein
MITKPCLTPAEGMNAYTHKYAYNYTYTCNRDSLITGKFGSSFYFVKGIDSYTRFVPHLITKIMFQSSIHHLIRHFHNIYTTLGQSVHIKLRNTSFYHNTCTLSYPHGNSHTTWAESESGSGKSR